MMNKFKKVVKPKESTEKEDEEIRVTAAGSVSAYVSRAAKVYGELEKSFVTITATGNALTKAVTTAEVIKRRFKGLHQVTKLSNQEIEDEFEPLEEGLEKVVQKRNVPVLEIRLSKDPLDTTALGYQEPLDESKVTEIDPEDMMKARGRGRGRGRGKGKGKGKSKSKSKSSEGKGKGYGKSSKSKGKGKGKSSYDSYEAPVKGKGKGKGKDKGKSKGKGKSSWGGYNDYDSGYSRGYGDSYGWGGYNDYGYSKGSSKGWGGKSYKGGKSKGKGKKGW